MTLHYKARHISNLLSIALAFICSQIAVVAEVQPLASLKQSERLWLSLVEGEVQPAREDYYRSSSEASITFYKEDGVLLEKGDHFASIDAKQLGFERRQLKLEEYKTSKLLDELDEQIDQHEDEIQELIDKLTEDKLTLTAVIELQSSSKNLKHRAQIALTEITDEISQLEKKITSEELKEKSKFDREELELKLEKQKEDFRRKEKSSILKARFPGELKISSQLETKDSINSAVDVLPGTLFATITDKSHYEIILPSKDSAFYSNDLQSLILTCETANSDQYLNAHFKETRQVDVGGRIGTVKVFQFGKNSSKLAAANVGNKITAYVFVKFNQSYHIIEKKDIALKDPETLKNHGWSGLVQKLYPTSTLIKVGPKSIAVGK